MNLTLRRFSTSKESTIGSLYIENKFQCYTLEDTLRVKKIAGETRIPYGTYILGLRTEGGMTQKYAERYGEMHKGMIWLLDVPDFQYVYMHTGNQRGHTEGCLLLGDSINNNTINDGFLGSSRGAYTRVYPKIAGAILDNERVRINIINIG